MLTNNRIYVILTIVRKDHLKNLKGETTMKTVYFIGSGYEAVKTVKVEADTPLEAFERAEQMYADNGWDFHYCELEVDKYEW